MQSEKWVVRYWIDNADQPSVKNWLLALSPEQFKSVFKELKILGISGNRLRLPHSRALGQGLFELRERNYGYRIYYGFCDNKVIILLAAGNKSKQQRDIRVARERLLRIQLGEELML